MKRSYLFVWCLVSTTCTSAPSPTQNPTVAPTRWLSAVEKSPPRSVSSPLQLSRDVEPTHYQLELQIDPRLERFEGMAKIFVRSRKPTRVLELHSLDQTITHIRATHADGSQVDARFEAVNADGLGRILFASDIQPGEWVLHVRYSAPFNRQLLGLYRVDSAGQSYAFTQFESTSARRAFPCFDEPSFKATYDVTLEVPNEFEAIANTQQVSVELKAKHRRITFAKTTPLPTYLMAWAVGSFDKVEAPALPPSEVRSHTIPLRAFAPKGRGALLAYALEHTPRMLLALEQYFGVAYPFDKLDLIAVPDFAASAMENAGAITFRDWLLLMDPKTAPEHQVRTFAYVMAHELAHQWFGNLVTMQWWDDLWLNEAFASWMGSRIIAELYPDYHEEITHLQKTLGAIDNDSLQSARRIREPIRAHEDIRNAFDAITYDKGGGVLSMFERWLGEETFRKGVRHYLNRHAFANATADDFLNALEESSQREIKAAFHSFLDQAGTPRIAVTLQKNAQGAPTLMLQQSRYRPIGSSLPTDQEWKVPVCFRYQNTDAPKDFCYLLKDKAAQIPWPEAKAPTWIHPNANGAGYYRWAIPAPEFAQLMKTGWSHLTDREKLSTADSLVAMFESASLPGDEVLKHLLPLAKDPLRAVATTPMRVMRFIHDHVVDANTKSPLQALAHNTYVSHYRKLGLTPKPKESGEQKLLRRAVVEFLAQVANDKLVRSRLLQTALSYLGPLNGGAVNEKVLAPEIVGITLEVAVQEKNASLFDALEQRLHTTQDNLMRSYLLRALSSTHDDKLAERALFLALDTRLRVNEVTLPLRYQLAFPQTRAFAWTWFEQHFDEIIKRVPPDRAAELATLAGFFCTDADAQKVKTFFATHPLPGSTRHVQGTVEAIRLCAARVNAHRTSITAALSPKLLP